MTYRPDWSRSPYLEGWMRHAIEVGACAPPLGDVPVGALVISPAGELLASGYNRREIDGDPTAHAELLALRSASRRLQSWRLTGCTLVCTLEPCLMCAGAILNARIERLIYGASDAKAGAVRSLLVTLEDPRQNHQVEVIRGIEAARCSAQLQEFFHRLRAEGQK